MSCDLEAHQKNSSESALLISKLKNVIQVAFNIPMDKKIEPLAKQIGNFNGHFDEDNEISIPKETISDWQNQALYLQNLPAKLTKLEVWSESLSERFNQSFHCLHRFQEHSNAHDMHQE